MVKTLVGPSLVTVVGVTSTDRKAMKSPVTASKDKQKKKHSTLVKKSTTDAKLEAVDQRWSERFSCLEALFLSKSMEKSDSTFQTVKMPAKSPPAGAVKGSEPFILPKPADQPVDQPVDRPMMATNQAHVEAPHDQPSTVVSHQPADEPSTDQTPVASSQFPGLSGLHTTQDTGMDLDSDSNIDPVIRPTSVFDKEGELLDSDQDLTTADTDQALSEEQTYRKL